MASPFLWRPLTGFLHPTPQRLTAFLHQYGRSLKLEDGTTVDVSCTEGVVEQGQVVAVIGEAHWELDTDMMLQGVGYRESVSLLRLVGPEGGLVVVSTKPEALSGELQKREETG